MFFNNSSTPNRSKFAKLVVHINNPTKSNVFKTTYCSHIHENDITTYLDANKLDSSNIKVAYFNNKPYRI